MRHISQVSLRRVELFTGGGPSDAAAIAACRAAVGATAAAAVAGRAAAGNYAGFYMQVWQRTARAHSHARTFGSTPFFILLIPCDMKTKEVITHVVSPSSVCEAWRRRSCAAAHRRHPGFHLWRRRRRQPGAQGQGRLGEQEDLPSGARGEKRRTRRDFVSRSVFRCKSTN